MHSYLRILLLSMLSVVMLTACQGDSPYDGDQDTSTDTPDDGGGSDDGDGEEEENTAQGISYVPLNVYEASDTFSGLGLNDVFRTQGWTNDADIDPVVPAYLVNPIDAATLLSYPAAVATDYTVTVDGIKIDNSESYPLLQKVIGTETYLQTALVFDLSDSVSGVDMTALVDEAKDYLTRVRASTNSTIRNQEFVIWVFADEVREVTDGFTSDAATLDAALDRVIEIHEARSFEPEDPDYGTFGGVTNLHRAIIEAIGRYIEGDYDFRNDGDNDLVDFAGYNGVLLSQLVVFSSGPDTYLEFSAEQMVASIESQAFLKYDTTAAADSGTMTNLHKPVFYYVVGGSSRGTTYSELSTVAESTKAITLAAGAYDFGEDLVSNQIKAIDARVDLDNQHLFRFAFVPRLGTHTVVFKSNATGFNYSLTSDYADEYMGDIADVGTPEEELISLVEITGPNGEYISGSDVPLSEAATFRAVTRWTARTYDGDDYEWSISGGTGTTNSDGSFTVTDVDDGGAVLTVTNVTRNTEDAELTSPVRNHQASILVTD